MDAREKCYNELVSLVFSALNINCPVLSGNMLANISIVEMNSTSTTICIDAPSYDMALWRKQHQIKHNGKYNYARSVNDYGGFFSGNASKYWANRTIKAMCDIKANEYNGEVICNVKL